MDTNPGADGDFSDVSLPLDGLKPPLSGEVHLWFLDLRQLGSPMGDPEAAFNLRRQRASRRFYLRLVLGAYLGLPGKDVKVLRAQRGKPLLDPQHHADDLEFSSAASPGCCLFGFTCGTPIGVDLEPLGRRTGNPHGLARRYFSAPEAAALAKLSGDELDQAFLRTWALKEAVVKAAGHGIANQLCRFEVVTDLAQSPRLLAIDNDDALAWTLATREVGDSHLAGVALRHPAARLRGFSLVPRPA